MDHIKQEAKSEDVDLPEKLHSDESAGTGRSYECNFCKRGFTNAQALGGHMNIHRKEKAKAKQHSQHEKYSKEDHYMSSSRYFAPIISTHDHHHHQNYHPTSIPQLNYQFHLPPQNPSYPHDQSHQSFEIMGTNEAHLAVNLSLQIGGSSVGDGEKRKEVEGNEVDLELRLGVDHP